MSAVTFTIPRVPPSPNEVMRMHWGDRRKLWPMWRQEIAVALSPEQREEIWKWRQARILVSIHQRRRKLLDHDNLYGSVKPILDGIVRCGWVGDDSPEFLCLQRVTQEIGKPETRITVQRIPEKA